jgi:DNA-binding NarL/FixJ family response regulator
MVADDRHLVRRRLRRLVEGDAQVDVIDDGDDVSAWIERICVEQPDVLVLDLSVADSAHLGTIAELRTRAPGTAIVVLASDDDVLFAREAIAAGAIGYVHRASAERDLAVAVHQAARGARYLSPRIAGLLRAADAAIEQDHLTLRETEILRLIASGYTTVEIAARLGRSIRTIESHRAAMLRKLGLSSRGELVRHGWNRGLLGDGPVM